MTNGPRHSEMESLLGAYALDALDDDEARMLEAHLGDCPRCRAEVAAHRETASLLAVGADAAPAAVWDRIAAGLDEPGEAPRLRITTQRRRVRTWAAASFAAAALVVAALGVTGVIDRGEPASNSLLAAALAADSNPQARRAVLRTGDGKVAAHAVLTPDGTGFIWNDNLSPVASDRTYQLWAVVGDQQISAGVLGTSPGVVAFKVAGAVSALAITEEASGGVAVTTNTPIASGLLAER